MNLVKALVVISLMASPSVFATPVGGYSVHDLDADGYLSPSEYGALQEQCRAHRDARGRARCDPDRLLPFEMLDADRDGLISESELIDALGRRHRRGAGCRQ
jgi:hypothetical protein